MEEEEKKKKVLVVEDEGLLRELLSEKMRLEGFEVFEAIDGEQGFEIALEEKPDLVLLDLLMPGIGGMEVLRRMRDDESTRSTPVIILSNLSGKEKIAEGAEYGAVEYLVKSNFTLEDIVTKIKEIG
ncbi:MAG: response regulator, partial [Candidatus Pacebacteria bacterium]|nr:response regulator [Candidatus Paceibacterota bacterium]